MKTIRNIVISIVVIMFLLFIIHSYYEQNKGKRRYIESSYKGLITKIEYYQDRRGLPTITIDNKIYYFGFEGSAMDYIKVGDSIVKEAGSDTIKVYRKNEIGEWSVKIFNNS